MIIKRIETLRDGLNLFSMEERKTAREKGMHKIPARGSPPPTRRLIPVFEGQSGQIFFFQLQEIPASIF